MGKAFCFHAIAIAIAIHRIQYIRTEFCYRVSGYKPHVVRLRVDFCVQCTLHTIFRHTHSHNSHGRLWHRYNFIAWTNIGLYIFAGYRGPIPKHNGKRRKEEYISIVSLLAWFFFYSFLIRFGHRQKTFTISRCAQFSVAYISFALFRFLPFFYGRLYLPAIYCESSPIPILLDE